MPETTNDDPRVVNIREVPCQVLYPGAGFDPVPDLTWLTSQGPLPRRMELTPDDGRVLLERLRTKERQEIVGEAVRSAHVYAGAQTGRIPDRISLAKKLADSAVGASISIYDLRGEELIYLSRLVMEDIHPPIYTVDPEMSQEAIRKLLQPGSPILPSPPRTDLDDVLDDLRRAGVKCGVQVISEREVVCWIGDIQEAFISATQPNWRAWGPTVTQFTCLFHRTWGANALEDAAKWMRERMPWTEGPAGTHGTARGVAGRG